MTITINTITSIHEDRANKEFDILYDKWFISFPIHSAV